MNHKSQPPLTLIEASSVRYLAPKDVRFSRHGIALRLTIGEEISYLRVTAIRLFPLSELVRFISVRDEDGKEIGILMDIEGLEPESLRLLTAELERRYLMPVVKRVIAMKERFGTVEWKVETNRGLRNFTMRNVRDSIAQPSPDRYLLTDVNGNRYDVSDIKALDPKSRAYLWRYL